MSEDYPPIKYAVPPWDGQSDITIEQWKSAAWRSAETSAKLRVEKSGLKKELAEVSHQLKQAQARVAELEKDNLHQRERRNAARDCISKIRKAREADDLER